MVTHKQQSEQGGTMETNKPIICSSFISWWPLKAQARAKEKK